MHPGRMGRMLGFILLTLLGLANFVQCKAFPEDNNKGKFGYRYEHDLGTQPFYSPQSFPHKPELYYTPHINGHPIFVPPISSSAGHSNKFIDDYYERNKEYTQSWTLATPVTYEYDHGNQEHYYEDSVASNSKVKNLLDVYEGGIHHDNYHILPIKPESPLNYGLKLAKNSKMENKLNKQSLRKKDKKKKLKDYSSEGVLMKTPVSVQYEAKPGASDDYAPEVVEVVGTKLSDDYAPEVVEIVGTKLSDDYAPEVVEVIGTKLSDDYAPEVVEVVRTKHDDDDDYNAEGEDIVKIKNWNKKNHLPKTDLVLENVDVNYLDGESTKEALSSKKDKTEVISDKKQVKKPTSSSSKIENKKSDKQEYKIQSDELETSSEQNEGHLKSYSKPVTEDFNELHKIKKGNEKGFEKIKSTAKPPSKEDHVMKKTHNIIKRMDTIKDDYENPTTEGSKTSSSQGSINNIFEGRTLTEDKSNEKLDTDSPEVLLREESLNTPEMLEGFDLENQGSGTQVDDENKNPLTFHSIDTIRSLTSLNSNIWSLIFNPNAELKNLKKCVTRSNETGFCKYIQQCDVPNIVTTLEQLLNNACVIDNTFIGVCCPEFPVHTVKVDWEQMPSNSDKRAEDEFGHNADDCGIRSDDASKAQSWPWKAPLVSMSNGKIFCGGVVINTDYVLTAAHCTTKIPKNQILVRIGQHDDSSGEDFAVVEIKRHAQYNPRTMSNDIALLKLGRRIVRDEHTDAVCLPDDDDDDDHAGEKAVLLGWQGSFSKSTIKGELLEVVTNKECEKMLGTKVPTTLLCTEARNEDERTCNADSGAPLVIEDNDKYEVIGILSWNRNDCDQRFPSTFSRVSRYVPWIKKHAV